MHINHNILQQNSHRPVITRLTKSIIITFWLHQILKSQHARTLLDIPSFWKLQENRVIFWNALAKLICSSGLLAGEQVAFIRSCDVQVSATYTHTKPPPHQQSSWFLLVEKCRRLLLISTLVSDHLPGFAAALWRSTGISLWQRPAGHSIIMSGQN